ncbi:HEAT repeat domain-containing protein [Actinopolymorpha alba]|uniref:HEAT repeat domain-containing protein n=1 Tax=Actinopolymorpha alba TaxID=533267 RepID=UPI0012F68C69|nr:HEAT repeat domain-containing protein [Actinopolymorpha alba]
MRELPPEDQPDQLKIGPIVIPIIDEDDPRFVDEREAWSNARRIAQALHSWNELSHGTQDADWRVRHECIDRLAARWPDDPGTLPTILALATGDARSEVRDKAVLRLTDFPGEVVRAALESAAGDPDPDVRWSANYVLDQHGFDHAPYWSDE